MRRRFNVMSFGLLLLAIGVLLATPLFLTELGASNAAPRVHIKAEGYLRAHQAYEEIAQAYWQSVVDKRRLRFAKRARGEAIVLNDYALIQPPEYSGPPRPPGVSADRVAAPADPGARGFPEERRRAARLRADAAAATKWRSSAPTRRSRSLAD